MKKLGILLGLIIVIGLVVVWAWLISASSPEVVSTNPLEGRQGVATNALCSVVFTNSVAGYKFVLDESKTVITTPKETIMGPKFDPPPVFRVDPKKNTLFISFRELFNENSWYELKFIAQKEKSPDIPFALKFRTSAKSILLSVKKVEPPKKPTEPVRVIFSDLAAEVAEVPALIYSLEPAIETKANLEGEAVLITAKDAFAPETEYKLTITRAQSVKGEVAFEGEGKEPFVQSLTTGAN